MDSQLIKSLIAALAASDLAELEYSHNGETLRLTRRATGRPSANQPAAPVAPPIPTPTAPPEPLPMSGSSDLRSPLYGVVHLTPTPDASPFVTLGQAVRAGQTVCVIEAMKMFNELRADRDGTLRAILVESGQEVEIGQTLFRVD
jgi:acetyl-CoA carboxylase biotin carboxyl carrier protein